jgi:O-antigen/teichoic acid export membrane protein
MLYLSQPMAITTQGLLRTSGSALAFTVGGMLPLLSGLVLLPYYTQMPAADFGLFALYTGLYVLGQTLINFGVDTLVGVSYVEHHDQPVQLRAVMSALLGFIIQMGLLAVGLSALGTLWFADAKLLPWNELAVASVASSLFYVLFKAYSNVLINQQRPVPYLGLAALNFLLVLAGTVLAFEVGGYRLFAPIWGRTFGLALSAVVVYGLWLRAYGIRWDRGQSVNWIRILYPMVTYNVLGWGLRYVDRFILQGSLGPETVGLFDFAFKLAMVLELIQAGLFNAVLPRIYRVFKERGFLDAREVLNRNLHSFTAVVVLAIPVLYLGLVGLLPRFMPRPEFELAYRWVGPLLWSMSLRGMFNVYLAPLFYFKETKLFPKFYALSMAVYLPVLVALVAWFGAEGAVWAAGAVSLLQVASVHWVSRSRYPMNYNWGKMLGLPVWGALTYLAATMWCSSIWAEFAVMMASNAAAVLLLFWRELRSLR